MLDDYALELWVRLGSEGKAPTDISRANDALNAYSVGIDHWIDRLSRTYFERLCKNNAHFKLVIAPYGGGKTHFLVSLGARALKENYAVSYIACTDNIRFDNAFEIYRAFIGSLTLPAYHEPGLNTLLNDGIIAHKHNLIREKAADPEAAMDMWIGTLFTKEYPEPSFGRVAAAALRELIDPEGARTGDAARRWLRGEIDTLTKDERSLLRVSNIPAKERSDFGRRMLLSMAKFVKEAGLNGVTILFDEVETLFNAKGKALLRVLSAMRVLIDLPMGIAGGAPLFAAFSAVPDVLEQFPKYPALQQRLAVAGASFAEGNDLAPQLDLGALGSQRDLLKSIGQKLVLLGERARDVTFDRNLQYGNIERLAAVADERDLDINARRLFVKACVTILDQQVSNGERVYSEAELRERYRGSFDHIKDNDPEDFEL
ncbi:MAG: BREX system ATP-binding domain-containing protein [Desulfomonilaceae bacterium]